METRPLLELAGGDRLLRRRRRARRGRLPALPRRGPLAHGRERRRQVHPDQGDHRGAPAVGRASCGWTASPVRFGSPHDAQQRGHPGRSTRRSTCCPNISVAENIALGCEPRRFGMIDWARMREHAHAVLADLGLDIDPASILGRHSLAVQQLVAIARAISTDVRVLVLDEPTSSLDLDECAELFRVIRDLKQRGVAILFVSHFLDQVYEICDRVTVLRDGKLVGEYLTREFLRIDLVQAMLGRSADSLRARSLPARRRRTQAALPQRPLAQRRVRHQRGGRRPGGGRGARRRRAAGVGAHRAGPGDHRHRQAGRRHHPHPGQRREHRRAPVGDLARHRLLVGEPAHRGDHQRAERAGEHHARAAGRTRHPAPDPAVAAARARAQLGRRARHPATGRGPAGGHAVRRQPAEGAARPVAGPLPPRCSCWTSRPEASTWARRSRCRT